MHQLTTQLGGSLCSACFPPAATRRTSSAFCDTSRTMACECCLTSTGPGGRKWRAAAEYGDRKPSDAAMLVVHSLGDRRLCCSSKSRALLCSCDVAYTPPRSPSALSARKSINQCTGCAMSCEGLGRVSEARRTMRPANRAIGVKAVTELAKLCEAAGEALEWSYSTNLLSPSLSEAATATGRSCSTITRRSQRSDHRAASHLRSPSDHGLAELVNTFWNEHAPRLSASRVLGHFIETTSTLITFPDRYMSMRRRHFRTYDPRLICRRAPYVCRRMGPE